MRSGTQLLQIWLLFNLTACCPQTVNGYLGKCFCSNDVESVGTHTCGCIPYLKDAYNVGLRELIPLTRAGYESKTGTELANYLKTVTCIPRCEFNNYKLPLQLSGMEALLSVDPDSVQHGRSTSVVDLSQSNHLERIGDGAFRGFYGIIRMVGPYYNFQSLGR